MKRYTPEELETVKALHKRWVESDGEEGERADLRGAYLTGADLTDAYLASANLRGAYLASANLRGANLTDANLRGADLAGANLTDANLRGANLMGADLMGAYLMGADLAGANLASANLRGAYLTDANLRGADLRGAYLTDDVKIQKAAVFTGLYTYLAMPIIAMDGTEWVCLGCYTRKVADWEADFWNNNREFPNNGSTKSREREMAYKTCLAWLEIHREAHDAARSEPAPPVREGENP